MSVWEFFINTAPFVTVCLFERSRHEKCPPILKVKRGQIEAEVATDDML